MFRHREDFFSKDSTLWPLNAVSALIKQSISAVKAPLVEKYINIKLIKTNVMNNL
ncbi:hypothetical protein GCM10009133_04100 [Cocleimonas flava]